MMLSAVLPHVVKNAKFDYFDIIALCWLMIGMWWGRKRGMSQEVLPLLQWLGILAAGGLLYAPFGLAIHNSIRFSILWADITAYLLIAMGVHLLYLWARRMLAEKLSKKDLFGHGEFYLGMAAGCVRFGCMLLVCLSLMNSHVATQADLAQNEKFQATWFSDIRFPTYGEFQQDVLINSFTGSWVESNLRTVLIATTTPSPAPKLDTIAQRSNKLVDEILSQNGKK
jgi:uncharacterized membrane protein required for colicin V production